MHEETSARNKEKKNAHAKSPLSSNFNRIGTALLDEEDEEWNIEGLIVLFDRPLSVLEPVSELKREDLESFRVMVAVVWSQEASRAKR